MAASRIGNERFYKEIMLCYCRWWNVAATKDRVHRVLHSERLLSGEIDTIAISPKVNNLRRTKIIIEIGGDSISSVVTLCSAQLMTVSIL